MFRIRRVYDYVLPVNRTAVSEVQEILRTQLQGLSEESIRKIPDQLRDPVKHSFRYILFVADNVKGHVKGFALISHAPDLKFCYLDYVATRKDSPGRGIGAALYERVREEALALGCIGLFFESLPDDPKLSSHLETLKDNRRRLSFYERFGVYPIIGTAYETPLNACDDNPPYLMIDFLGKSDAIERETARKIVRAILELKYGKLCPQEYIELVVESFKDERIRVREPRYEKTHPPRAVEKDVPVDRKIVFFVNEKHMIHHVKDRGYVESPVRVKSILRYLEKSSLFLRKTPKHYGEKHLLAVHSTEYIAYFKKAVKELESGKALYPYIFPIRNENRPPADSWYAAGYFCIDTFTPINREAFLAATGAVDCALSAADEVLSGTRIAYALVRPPGHHAERKVFGGFCYFNSAAIAAEHFSHFGRTAILDVDYHHGNGQQDIFYLRNDVLTVSIHGHPRIAYPFFSGYENERGEGEGRGFNLNIPLPESLGAGEYRQALEKAIARVKRFKPAFLVIPLGLDTAAGDPTGSWNLTAADLEENGRMIGETGLPTLVVQEGGYNTRNLGRNALHFLSGLWKGVYG